MSSSFSPLNSEEGSASVDDLRVMLLEYAFQSSE